MNDYHDLYHSLDDARLVRVNVERKEIAAWFGGDLVHLLNSDLYFEDAFSLGRSEDPNDVTVHDVIHALTDRWND